MVDKWIKLLAIGDIDCLSSVCTELHKSCDRAGRNWLDEEIFNVIHTLLRPY